jgi:YbgC/YbaW family acyl-CoA thioester hydrolase
MPATPFIYQSRVRFGDTDASGRIFYVALLNHVDAAEAEFMRSRGIGYRAIQDASIGYPRVRVECDYTGALVYDDLMDIAVTVERVGRASFTLAFDVSVESRPAARAKVTIACIDRRTQRATPIPENVRTGLCA